MGESTGAAAKAGGRRDAAPQLGLPRVGELRHPPVGQPLVLARELWSSAGGAAAAAGSRQPWQQPQSPEAEPAGQRGHAASSRGPCDGREGTHPRCCHCECRNVCLRLGQRGWTSSHGLCEGRGGQGTGLHAASRPCKTSLAKPPVPGALLHGDSPGTGTGTGVAKGHRRSGRAPRGQPGSAGPQGLQPPGPGVTAVARCVSWHRQDVGKPQNNS